MNEPLFELVSDENGMVRRPVTPDPDWTSILAPLLARWTGRRSRSAVTARGSAKVPAQTAAG